MGKVYLDTSEIGTFSPQTEGTSGNILLNATVVGTFTLASTGSVYANATVVGTYSALSLTLQIPQVRIEIFRGPPKFMDDNFAKPDAWLKTSGGTSTFSTDPVNGDYALLDAGDQASCTIEHSVTFSSTTYPKIIARIKEIDSGGSWRVRAYYDAAWHTILSGSTPGVFEGDIYAAGGKVWLNGVEVGTFDGAEGDSGNILVDGTVVGTFTFGDSGSVYANGSLVGTYSMAGKTVSKIEMAVLTAGKTGKFDYVAICKKSLLVPSDTFDVVDQMEIIRPVLQRGIAGADVTFPNFDAKYTDKINNFDRIIIYLWRKGDTMKKQFGGVIMDSGYVGGDRKYYIHLKCMGLGEQLHAPESLVQKLYQGTGGKTILTETIANCSHLTDKFIDVDGDIASTHDMELNEVLPFGVITEVCRKAKTAAGVIGFDGYIDSAGNTHIFKQGKYKSVVSLAIERYNRSLDVHRVRNKIKVYGKANAFLPRGQDEWTEDSLDGWSMSEGASLTLFPAAKVGANCIQCKSGASGWTIFKKTFSPITLQTIKQLIFWKRFLNVSSVVAKIRLLAPDTSNYFEADMGTGIGWEFKTYNLGREHEYDAEKNPNGVWTKTGSPNWWTLQGIQFYVDRDGANRFTDIDGLYFTPDRWEGTAEDPVSIAKYGTRWAKPQTFEELISDAECELKAKGIINDLKAIVESFNGMQVEGDNRFLPGYLQKVSISNDNVDLWVRIMEFRQVVVGVDWVTILSLSNEDALIDYVFSGKPAEKVVAAARYAKERHEIRAPPWI